MARLIDSDEFYRQAIDYIVKWGAPSTNYKEGLHDGATRILCIAGDLPAVDAVEVVRCKDCVHRGIAFECPMCRREYNDDYDEIITDYATDNGFCNWGERGTE